MKNGWQTKKLGEVLQRTETINPLLSPKREFEYIDVSSVSNKTFQIEETQRLKGKEAPSRARRIVKANDILFATVRPTLRRIAVVPKNLNDQVCSTGFFVLRPLQTIDYRYLYHFLFTHTFMEQMEKLQKGASYPAVTDAEVRSQMLAFPPLPEQQRIVAILDKAFEDIAIAKANAEKNLNNAREVFQSFLQSVFTQRGEGWIQRKISEIAKHSLGKMLDKAKNKGKPQPYLRNFNVRWFTFDLSDLLQMPFLPEESAKYTAIKGDILICEGGYPGRAAIWDEDYPIYFQKALHRVRFHEPMHNKWFLYYLYSQDQSGKLKQHFSGTGIQHFTGEVLARFELPLPPLTELRRTIAKFDDLSAETKKLEAIYRQKLTALEELKKSILNQAFAGKLPESIIDACINNTPPENPAKNVMPVQRGIQSLDSRQGLPRATTRRGNDNSFSTANGHAGINSATNVIPFPKTIPGISTTDLHAGILAIAYHQHESNPEHLKTFGHVKAEKIAHMVEAYTGIDLGRNPVKDAAGPNDFHHLQKVESRARKAGYFDFKKDQRAGYSFNKFGRFNDIMEKTKKALGKNYEAIRIIIDQMLAMNTQQSEILATVYAAWNNLLIRNEAVSDEAIVFEARENWHENKLNIPAEKFFKAITWMREKNIVPKGTGKLVKKRT